MTRAQTLRTPDRVVQRHREIRGPARKSPRSGSISLLEELDPGSARRLRHRLSGTRGCAPSSIARDVIYARERHQWMNNDIYEIDVIYVSSVADTTQH